MNRIDLVNTLVDTHELTRKTANAIVSTIFDAEEGVIARALKKGDKVGITGFGTFTLRKRAARMGRNPQTGASVKIAASKAPAFKAGASLKGFVNGKAAAPKKGAKKTIRKPAKKGRK